MARDVTKEDIPNRIANALDGLGSALSYVSDKHYWPKELHSHIDDFRKAVKIARFRLEDLEDAAEKLPDVSK